MRLLMVSVFYRIPACGNQKPEIRIGGTPAWEERAVGAPVSPARKPARVPARRQRRFASRLVIAGSLHRPLPSPPRLADDDLAGREGVSGEWISNSVRGARGARPKNPSEAERATVPSRIARRARPKPERISSPGKSAVFWGGYPTARPPERACRRAHPPRARLDF